MANRTSTLAMTSAALAKAYVDNVDIGDVPLPRTPWTFLGKVNNLFETAGMLTSPKFSSLFAGVAADKDLAAAPPAPATPDLQPEFKNATDQAFVVGSQISPSVCRRAKRNTALSVSAVAIARAE